MKRIVELDGIRGVAIGLVLVWHYMTCQVPRGSPVHALASATRLTWSGVDLFFVLSGFLIVGILVDNRNASNLFRVFYVRRACRILPLYYAVFTGFLLLLYFQPSRLEWLHQRPLALWSYAALVQNFQMSSHGFGAQWMGVTWSLAIEEQFYLVIPLMVRFLDRTRLAATFAGLIVLALLYRTWSTNLGGYVLPFARSDSILLGGLLALLVRDERTFSWFVERRWLVAVAFVSALGGFGYLTAHHAGVGGTVNHAALAVLYGLFLLLPLLWSGTWMNRGLESGALVWLGLRSYGIYLFHQPVSGIVHGLWSGRPPRMDSLDTFVVTMVALGLTLVLAEVSYRVFESRFLSYGHRYRYEIPGPART